MRVPFVIWGLSLSGSTCLIDKHAGGLDAHECGCSEVGICIGYPYTAHVGHRPCSAECGGSIRYK